MEMDDAYQVGAMRVMIFNAGDLALRLAEEMAVPDEVWRPVEAAAVGERRLFPSLSVLITSPGAKVLVDINDYTATVAADSPYLPPNYAPPPGIAQQLAAVNARPDDITHVVITHAHWDHFAGTTQSASDGPIPTFPHARYYLGAADWESAETQAELRNPDSLVARTLGALRGHGVLELVDSDLTLADGIEIRRAPGESPGHQIVRVHSEGQTLYVLGDLFHDPVEVAHPDWMVTWADPQTMLATRQTIMPAALAENALLIAAHIPGAGRLVREGEGARWVAM